MSKRFEPTPEQAAALAAFAAKYGERWKAKLASAWLVGRDASEPNGHLLRQVRNQGGPRWLATYQPKESL